MNYKKIYHDLISKARLENRTKLSKEHLDYVYYENHHIIPRCVKSGFDVPENLILLTAKEHFIAHKLLTKIYPNNISIVRAFNLMTHMNKSKYTLSSRDYTYAVELYKSSPVSQETKDKIRAHGNLGRKFSQSFKDKISKVRLENELSKGENNGMYGKKHKPDSIQKMKERVFTNETKKLMSLNHTNVSGKNNPMFGTKFKWMTNGEINKRINLVDVEDFLKNNWKIGQTRI